MQWQRFVNKRIPGENLRGKTRSAFVSFDDLRHALASLEFHGHSLQLTRKLVEHDGVLCMFSSLGSSQNIAVQKYLNAKKIPQLFVGAGTTRFGDYKAIPWTMGWQPSYQLESRIFARHIMETKPNAKVGVLMQNDDFGKDYMQGLLDGFGDKAKTFITQHLTYDVTDPTIDSALVKLKSAGCDVFVSIATPKFAAQAIRKVVELGWKPEHYLVSVSESVASVLKPAGLENAKGVISATYLMGTTSPEAATDAGMQEYFATMKQFYPAGDPHDSLNVLSYSCAATMAHVLQQCGNDLTRANVMKQASNIKAFAAPLLYPGIDVSTSPTDYYPIDKKVLMRFDGEKYVTMGKPMTG